MTNVGSLQYLYYESQYFLNMEELWTNWPQREIDGPVKAYVLGQWAFWLHQVLVINIEQRRKDHWQMLSHHFVTIALIASSYAYHHTRVGHVIMISLDVVDLIFPVCRSAILDECMKSANNLRSSQSVSNI